MKIYKWCAIDAEGDVGKKGLLGVAFYSDEYQCYITDHEEIKQLLSYHANHGYTFLCHNAQYDIPVIFWQLKIPVKVVYFNGRFNRGEWKYDKRESYAQIWDTLALSGGISLRDLGRALHVEKYETPQRLLGIDPDRFTWFCDAHSKGECEECYAVRDAEIVWRFMESLCEQLASWGIKPKRRISNLAVSVWRELDHPENIRLENFNARKLSREAFHGGRVETFKLGRISNIFMADVASMYPSILQNTPYPDPTGIIYLRNPQITYFPTEGEGVIDCDITVPNMHVPPLPYSDRGTIKYPIGRIRGCWTLGEIRYAITLGCTLNRIYRLAYSPKSVYPFTSFVGVLWEMRKAYEEKGDPRSFFAKLLMNNLYGRLGVADTMQQKTIYPYDENVPLDKQPRDWWYTNDGELYLVEEKDKKFGGDFANVMWAAQTTAYARIKLHQYIILQGQDIAYCDTDSIFSTKPIVGLGEGLGSLRSPEEYEEIIIAAPKMYAIKRYVHQMPDTWWTEPCKTHHQRECDDCRWYGKVKGVRRDMALKFMKEGIATYDQPIRPIAQGIRHIKAGTWVEVTKRNLEPAHRRQPINPDIILSGNGYSDTAPPMCGFPVRI